MAKQYFKLPLLVWLFTTVPSISLLGGLAGCSTPIHKSELHSDAQTSIAEFNRRYLVAINEGDIDTLALLTTDDHMMIAAGGQPVIGKEALVKAMKGAFERFNIEEHWAPEQTVVSGNLAWQRGTFVVVATPKAGGDSLRVSGTFMRTYQRQADGNWMMVIDTHSNE